MSDNWIVQNLENALETWNEKLSEIWQLITQSPENFKKSHNFLLKEYFESFKEANNWWLDNYSLLPVRKRLTTQQTLPER